jgi:hypothetical protein
MQSMIPIRVITMPDIKAPYDNFDLFISGISVWVEECSQPTLKICQLQRLDTNKDLLIIPEYGMMEYPKNIF